VSATQVAPGVWRVKAGFPLSINAFLIEEQAGGVTVFDSGDKRLGKKIKAAADKLGGARRLVLGNAHADHRGGAPHVGAEVFCHPDERADVEGDGGIHYFDFNALGFPSSLTTPPLLRSMDSGPVTVAGTLAEGDEVAGFEVVHLPGHGPGCIGLWRAPDRLAITNDCFALFDPRLPRPGKPRVPHRAFNWSTETARKSMRKLAALKPATCWPGHYGPLTGDCAATLERAAG
jgi:glyoxylase-like metal-dependent hydrolase (beta-lactamase superfamily II)